MNHFNSFSFSWTLFVISTNLSTEKKIVAKNKRKLKLIFRKWFEIFDCNFISYANSRKFKVNLGRKSHKSEATTTIGCQSETYKKRHLCNIKKFFFQLKSKIHAKNKRFFSRIRKMCTKRAKNFNEKPFIKIKSIKSGINKGGGVQPRGIERIKYNYLKLNEFPKFIS